MFVVTIKIAYPPPNILPPLVGEGALVVEILADANILDSAPPNSEVLCAVVVG